MSDHNHFGPEDRERLIRVDAAITNLIAKVEDHETRLRWIERKLWTGLGIFLICSVAIEAYAALRK